MLNALLDTMKNNSSGSPTSALFGEYGLFSNPTGAWDLFKNGRTNEINQAIAEQNLAFQRENLDYNRSLNEEIFNRADTAYQRQVADMRAAGLNPLMAQGGAETGGSATPTEALHNDYQHTDIGNASALQSIGDLLNTMQNYQIGFDFAREQAAKADSAQAQSKVDQQTALDKIFSSKADWTIKMNQANDLFRENRYNTYFGLNRGMSETERMAKIFTRKLNPNEPYNEYFWDNNRNEFWYNWNTDDPNKEYKDMASKILAQEFAGIIGGLIKE